MTEALTWDQGNTQDTQLSSRGRWCDWYFGYSPMRAQKQMCVAAALWFVSQTTLLLWLVWSVPHSFIPLGEKYPSLTSYFNTSFTSLSLVMLTQPFQTPEVMVRDQKRAGLGMVALWSGCDLEMYEGQRKTSQFSTIVQSCKNTNAYSYAIQKHAELWKPDLQISYRMIPIIFTLFV